MWICGEKGELMSLGVARGGQDEGRDGGRELREVHAPGILKACGCLGGQT